MTYGFLATTKLEERNNIRRLLKELKITVEGEASNWETILKHILFAYTDILAVDWNLIPENQNLAIKNLRNALVIGLISHLETRQQAALSASANAFISKIKMPARIAE